MEILFIWLLCGIISAIIASGKGRSGIGWFFGGILLGPLGIIIVAVLPKIKSEVEEKQIRSGEYKKCPQCAELIKKEAKICRFCGNKFKDIGNNKNEKEEVRYEKCPKCETYQPITIDICPNCGQNLKYRKLKEEDNK